MCPSLCVDGLQFVVEAAHVAPREGGKFACIAALAQRGNVALVCSRH